MMMFKYFKDILRNILDTILHSIYLFNDYNDSYIMFFYLLL